MAGVSVQEGSQKVTCFAAFLMPHWVGDVGTLRLSIWEDMARLETLNSNNPSLSEVVYEGKIWGKVASSNIADWV